jgi:transcription initiation factor TFIIIB Brf1 subunit/transcription initiation factor TFIIB
VLEPIFQDQQRESVSYEDPQHNTQEIHCFLQDIGAHAEICQSMLDSAKTYCFQIKAKLAERNQKKFKDKELAAYAIYETLCRHHIPRTIKEIEYFTAIDASTLFSIESLLNVKETFNQPLDYVDRFCTLLEIPFWDTKTIKGIVFNLDEQEKLKDVRPQCVVALAIHLYCKEKKIKIGISKICEICDVSCANIYKLVRVIKEPFASKISLLDID